MKNAVSVRQSQYGTESRNAPSFPVRKSPKPRETITSTGLRSGSIGE
jgi:hypothetical protein